MKQRQEAGNRGSFPSGDFEETLGRFRGQIDEPAENAGDYDIVVVGGGLSGLSAAWKLEVQRVLLLDEGNRFGGNARLENHQGLRYPSAGSCLQYPVAGSETADLLQDLGLWDQWQSTDAHTLVIFETKRLLKGLGELTSALLKHPSQMLRPQVLGLTGRLIKHAIAGKKYISTNKKLGDPVFEDLFAYLDRFKPGAGKFPELPWSEACGWSREEMETFDAISLRDLFFDQAVREALPEGLVPHREPGDLVSAAIETTLRTECLSLDEVSAYVGLYFLVGYLRGTLVTFPGGNGYIAERLCHLLGERGHCTLRGEARVSSVTRNGQEWHVVFEHRDKRYQATARSVVWAAPKHVVPGIIAGLPQSQLEAIGGIEHRDYCMANVFLKDPVLAEHFGGYLVGGDPSAPGGSAWCRSGACLSANWMDKDFSKEQGVLTLLKPITGRRDQGRLADADFQGLQRAAHQEIVELLDAHGVSADLIEDIKIWRWPHGLVVSKVGQLKSDLFVRASGPCDGLFFANQDTVGIGNLESAVRSGYLAARQVRSFLGTVQV